jgi:hypothetical protein
MPQGEKSNYPGKLKQPVVPSEDSYDYERRGLIIKQAAERAWFSVNKHDADGLRRHAHRHVH